MTQGEILNLIREELPTLKKRFGVSRIGLFGSYAKKNNNIDSDIDILVELDPPYAKHYFELLFFLEKKILKKIDLVRRGEHLREKFIQHIEKEIIYA